MLNIKKLKEDFPLIAESYIGQSISLSIFTENDIVDDYVSWLNDPENVKYSDQRFTEHTKASCSSYLKSFEKADAIFIAIKDFDSNLIIGTMSVYFNRNHSTADIGLLVGRNAWGKGVGLAAWKRVMDHLLIHKYARKVTGGTLSCNHGMLRIMEKSGMVSDGVRSQQQLVNNVAYDIIHFAKFIKG